MTQVRETVIGGRDGVPMLFGSYHELHANSDWACEEDFVPTQRDCPNFEVVEDIKWEDFLNVIIEIYKN